MMSTEQTHEKCPISEGSKQPNTAAEDHLKKSLTLSWLATMASLEDEAKKEGSEGLVELIKESTEQGDESLLFHIFSTGFKAGMITTISIPITAFIPTENQKSAIAEDLTQMKAKKQVQQMIDALKKRNDEPAEDNG